MVAFATLFLGLILGLQAVEVAVDGPVASVELLLDGELVAARSAPPWLFHVDFGDAYEPHILEAVARDQSGGEIGRAEQWLNLPRREAEAEVVLAAGRGGTGIVARVLWESRVSAQPERIEATFDGRPLAVDDPERILLPPHDPDELHLLQVELFFPGNYSTVVEKTFGGTYAEEVEARLTAVPIVLPKNEKTPAVADLTGQFVDRAGRALEVVAIDEGPSDLVVVRDAAVQTVLDEMVAIQARGSRGVYRSANGTVVVTPRQMRYLGRLKKGQRVRFLYPVTFELFGHRTRQEQFPTSRFYAPADGGLAWLMVRERRPLDPASQRLAEAVAVAGMEAALRNRRRAVLLLLARESADRSRISADAARRYLESLRVPLRVWALEDQRDEGPWGPQSAIRNLSRLQVAIRELAASLERQRIVWLRGRFLPQSIRLHEESHLRLAD